MNEMRCLAEYALNAKPQDISWFMDAMLNWLGVTYSARNHPSVKTSISAFKISGETSQKPLFQKEHLSRNHAVMIDCFASSADAYDDIHFETSTHPFGPAAAAAIGAVHLQPTNVQAVLEAIAAGMEIEVRIASSLFVHTAASPGWYPTGVAGCIGAAAAAGRILGLSVEKMENALALAAAYASGVRGTHGSMAGTFVPAIAASNGFEAALLAKEGFTCNGNALFGENGLLKTIAGKKPDPSILQMKDREWYCKNTVFKKYPYGYISFAMIEGLKKVKSIPDYLHIHVSHRAYELGGNLCPKDANEAIVSLVYIAARTLCNVNSLKHPTPSAFYITEEELAVMERIQLYEDDHLQDEQCRLETPGEVIYGNANLNMSHEEVIDKFIALTNIPKDHIKLDLEDDSIHAIEKLFAI